MAASTLHTLLIKLGFDVTELTRGTRTAKSELDTVAKSAQSLTAAVTPSAAALNNMSKALDNVAGSTGARVSLTEMARATQAVATSTNNSVPALNAFARAANTVATSTGSGSALNAYARATNAVAAASGGSVPAITSFARAAAEASRSMTPQRFVSFANGVRDTARASMDARESVNSLGTAGENAAAGLGAAGAAGGVATGGLSGVAGSAGAAAGGLGAAGATAAGTADRLLGLTNELTAAISALDEMSSAEGTAESGTSHFADELRNLSTQVEEVVADVTTMVDSFEEASQRVDALIGRLGALRSELSNLPRGGENEGGIGGIGAVPPPSTGPPGGAPAGLDYSGAIEEIERMLDSSRRLKDELDDLGDSGRGVSDGFGSMGNIQEEFNSGAASAADLSTRLSDLIDRLRTLQSSAEFEGFEAMSNNVRDALGELEGDMLHFGKISGDQAMELINLIGGVEDAFEGLETAEFDVPEGLTEAMVGLGELRLALEEIASLREAAGALEEVDRILGDLDTDKPKKELTDLLDTMYGINPATKEAALAWSDLMAKMESVTFGDTTSREQSIRGMADWLMEFGVEAEEAFERAQSAYDDLDWRTGDVDALKAALEQLFDEVGSGEVTLEQIQEVWLKYAQGVAQSSEAARGAVDELHESVRGIVEGMIGMDADEILRMMQQLSPASEEAARGMAGIEQFFGRLAYGKDAAAELASEMQRLGVSEEVAAEGAEAFAAAVDRGDLLSMVQALRLMGAEAENGKIELDDLLAALTRFGEMSEKIFRVHESMQAVDEAIGRVAEKGGQAHRELVAIADDLLELASSVHGGGELNVAELEQYEDALRRISEIKGPLTDDNTKAIFEELTEKVIELRSATEGLSDTDAGAALEEVDRILEQAGPSAADLAARIDELTANLEGLITAAARGEGVTQELFDRFHNASEQIKETISYTLGDKSEIAPDNILADLADEIEQLRAQLAEGGDIVPMLQAYEDAIQSFMSVAQGGQLNFADMIEGLTQIREAFKLVQGDAGDMGASLETIGQSSAEAADALGNFETFGKTLEAINHKLGLTEKQIHSLMLSLTSTRAFDDFSAALDELGKAGVDSNVIEQIRALGEPMAYFNQQVDLAGEKADALMGQLEGMAAAGKLTAEQFEVIQRTLMSWVTPVMGEGFFVNNFTPEKLQPLLELNDVLEKVVSSGSASAEQIAKVRDILAQMEAARPGEIAKGLSQAAEANGTMASSLDDLSQRITGVLEGLADLGRGIAEAGAKFPESLEEAGYQLFEVEKQFNSLGSVSAEQLRLLITHVEQVSSAFDVMFQTGAQGLPAFRSSVDTLLQVLQSLGTEGSQPFSTIEEAAEGLAKSIDPLDQHMSELGMTGNQALGAIDGIFAGLAENMARFDGKISDTAVSARALLKIVSELQGFGEIGETGADPRQLAILTQYLEAIAARGVDAEQRLKGLNAEVAKLIQATELGAYSLGPIEPATQAEWDEFKATEGIERARASAQNLVNHLNEAARIAGDNRFEFSGLREAIEQWRQLGTGDIPLEQLGAEVDIIHQKASVLEREALLARDALEQVAAVKFTDVRLDRPEISETTQSALDAAYKLDVATGLLEMFTAASAKAKDVLAQLKAHLDAIRTGAGVGDLDRIIQMLTDLDNNVRVPGIWKTGAEPRMKVGDLAEIQAYLASLQQTTAAENQTAMAARNLANAISQPAAGAGAAAGALNAVAGAAANAAGNLNAAAAAAGGGGGGAAGGGGMGGGGGGGAGGGGGGLGGAFNNLPGPANRAAAAIKQVAVVANDAGDRASFLNRTLSMAFAFSGGVAITNLFGFISNAVFGFNSRLEQAQIAFETLMGSADEADQFIQTMIDFAEITPFEFKGLMEAVQSMTAMGFAAQDTLPILEAVGDAIAAQGRGQEYIERVTRALGQMLTAGKVRAQDMRQLTEAGIPAWRYLAEAIGKTTAEVQKLSEQGLIPAGVGIEAIVKGMREDFGGMMQRQARTAAGAFSTVKDAAVQTVAGAVRPLFELLSQGMAMLADFFIGGGGKALESVIWGIGAAIAVGMVPHLYAAAAAAGVATVAIAGLTVPIMPLIVGISTLGAAWNANLGGMQTTLGPVVAGIFDFGAAVLEVAANSGLLIPILEALVLLITVRWVAGLVASGLAMLWNVAAAVLLSGAFTGIAVSSGAASVGITTMTGALGGLAIAGSLAGGAITLFAAAILLVMLNFDRFMQGLRGVAYAFVGLIKTMVDTVAQLPFIGDAFKGVSEGLQGMLDEIERSVYEAEANIRAKEQEIATGVAGIDPLAGLKDRLGSSSDDVAAQTQSLVEQFGQTIQGINEAAKQAGGDAMLQMASEIQAKQNAPLEALKTLHEMVRNELSQTQMIAQLYGMYISEDLAQGLASGNPATYAQAVATRKLITEQLDILTDGAFSAGQNTTTNLAGGLGESGAMSSLREAVQGIGRPIAEMLDTFLGTNMFSNVLESVVSNMSAVNTESRAVSNVWDTRYKPSANAVALAMKGVNAELSSAARSAGLSALNSAFNEIRSSANRFFDDLHRRNLEAIDDALKHKNAILDAKAALNQSPVTAAQRALDFQRKQIQEWRLREAVATARSPEEYRDAVLALQDFLAQAHIDEMQQQVDAAQEVIDTQKEANQRRAEEQREAENERYRIQQESFERQLELLRRYLEQHPGEWQRTEEMILNLLDSYGIDYHDAGMNLGEYFVEGLRENIKAAQEAAMALADPLINKNFGDAIIGQVIAVQDAVMDAIKAIQSMGTSSQGGGMIGPGGEWSWMGPTHHGGLWEASSEHLAMIQKGETVLPPEIARAFRQWIEEPAGAETVPSFEATSTFTETAGGARGGRGDTYVFQIGDQKMGEIVDGVLYDEAQINQGQRVSTGSLR